MSLIVSSNIDRLWAIWQALHGDDNKPNSFVIDRHINGGNFAFDSDKIEKIDTELYPFRKSVEEDGWYTSRDAKRTEPFGYSYPETANLPDTITEDVRRKLRATLNKIYPPPAEMIQQSKRQIETAGQHLLPQAHILGQIKAKKVPATVEKLGSLIEALPKQEELLKTSLEPSKPLLRKLAPDNKYLEWLTNIRAQKHALNGKYTVHVFLGEPQEENTALWPSAPTHVGTFAPLGQPPETGCGKCLADQRDQTEITSQIPLTVALLERYLAGLLEDLSERRVVDYLKENLHWRVLQVGLIAAV